MVPAAESEIRIRGLQRELGERGIDGAFFVYPLDVYYFCGSRQNAGLWVPADGPPTLLVRKSLTRARQESLVEDVRPFPPSGEFAAFFDKKVGRIGLTFDVLPVQQYQYYQKLFSVMEFVDISDIYRRMRSVKSPWELAQMKESGRRLCDVFEQVPSFLTRGIRECELAAGIEFRLRAGCTQGPLRMRALNQEITGLAVAGESAAAPGCFDGPVTGKGLSSSAPYGPSGNVIAEGAPVLVDYPGVFNGYIVDMTRVFAFGGLDTDMKEAFEVSLEIQSRLTNILRPGLICEDLYEGAVKIAESAGLGEKFMGHTGEQSKFVGHGVGLELDELPVLARRFRHTIEAGHTIAIEPKFVFPGRGVIGIENTFAVTATGCEKLTDFPDDIVYL